MPGEDQGRRNSDGEYDLGIICGYGSLPFEAAQGAAAAGRKPYLIGIANEADPDLIARHGGAMITWGQLGRLFGLLRERAITDIVLVGGIKQRPDWRKTRLDWTTMNILPQALLFMFAGDNTVLSGTIKLIEKRGFKVYGVHQIAPQLLVQSGAVVGGKPGRKDFQSIRIAYAVSKALGKFDVGQAAVAEAGHVVAVEGVEGTDAMLGRVAEMRRIGRMPEEGKNGVLVKTMKPGQDARADLPAIGPMTIDGVVAAGLRGIAVEAGYSLIVEREETLRAAKEADIYIYGLSEAEIAADD